jgi:hypothetical protein
LQIREGLADVPILSDTARHREKRRARVLHVFAQPVAKAELHLDRDEVGAGIPNIGEEEKSSVQPAEAVTPVDEVVAAAQHLGAPVVCRVHHAYVRIGRDDRLIVTALDCEIRLAELTAAR